eukprot:CAMPEP_0197574280 /NCGR_PEP_ID=MMETSP1326-20131121/12_1 /TAXON_ID=1155430 /ORGANISM="Genus nov. species nov., Strain RCC2288" /LENGTH=78 /DNA_ID=CAMNT_0043136811 /DNA_START=223 /DNA_END=456 /DNA_ORIENTATION=-
MKLPRGMALISALLMFLLRRAHRCGGALEVGAVDEDVLPVPNRGAVHVHVNFGGEEGGSTPRLMRGVSDALARVADDA